MDHADIRYLEAKRTVDDRALVPRVFDRMIAELPPAPYILEAGAGTGVTIPRLVEGGISAGRYRGVDRSETVLSFAREQRAADLEADRTAAGFRVGDLSVEFERGDALTAFEGETADLIVAQSFLDLVPIEETLRIFERALTPGGLLYAPLTFDGTTVFQPDHPADPSVLTAYHDHIADQPGRDPQAGRHVLDTLQRGAGTILDVASSDWIVRPTAEGYPANERQFLERIVDFVEAGATADPDATAWAQTRRTQIDSGKLWYVAHQYDILYRTQQG